MADLSFWHPLLTHWVDQVDECWKQMRIPTEVRLELRHDLVADLGAARLAGATIDDLTQSAPDQFARELADAASEPPVIRGRQRAEHAPQKDQTTYPPTADLFEFRLVLSSILGALAGGIAALVVIYPVGLRVADVYPNHEVVAVLGTHFAAAVLAAVCGSLAVQIAFHRDCRSRQLAGAAGLGLLLCGAVAVAPAVALAWSTGFENSPSTNTSVALVILVVLAVGMWAVASYLRNSAPAVQQPQPPI